MERTEARRQEAKQAKRKKQDRRLFKQQAQKLLHLLDKHGNRPLRIHIWTDTVSSKDPSLLRRETDLDVDDGGTGGKKKKGRNRSNSNAGDTPKKVHPRSKEAASPAINDVDEGQAPLSCMSHFFFDNCSSVNKKGGGCAYKHYFAPCKTLASIIKNENELKLAQVAAEESIPDDLLEAEPKSMEMLQYHCVNAEKHPGDNGPNDISDDVFQELSKNDIKIANIVYAAVNDVLIYDRCRDGVFLNERELLFAIAGHDDLGKRRISVGDDDETAGSLTKLPGSILEHTLTYLPDLAVTACSMVCKDWYNEIGRASPNLWRHLLERHCWPLPDGLDQSQQAFRDIFIQHYTSMRDMNSIKLAMTAFITRKGQPEREMCYQDFSTRKQSPTEPNACVSVEVWSRNRILAAYSQDCSLRLFEAVPKAGGEKICKELVFQSFDPYRKTKRRHCKLLSMVLDEECIGSLCHVDADTEDGEAYILVVVNREEFLLGESSGVVEKGGQPEELELNIIDIGEAIINYFLSTDTVDHRQLQLMDFLQDGGDTSEIEVLTSGALTACGNGRFLVEVSISIPSDHLDDADDDDDDEQSKRLIDRKLVLFSASVGAIVWVGDSSAAASPLQPRAQEMTLTSLRRVLPGEYRPTCNILVASPTTPDLRVCSVDYSGNVENPILLEGSLLVRNEILQDSWGLISSPKRLVVLTEGFAIAADGLEKDFGEGVRERKTILSFYPLHNEGGNILYQTLELYRIQALRLVNLRDNHISLVCREYGDFIHVDAAEGVRMAIVPQSACLIIIHVPSRTEIYRTSAGVENFDDDYIDVPIVSIDNDSTIGCALNWHGVSITGDDVRHMGTSSSKNDTIQENSAKKKKKKHSGTAKGRRKDGFARGMSLRG